MPSICRSMDGMRNLGMAMLRGLPFFGVPSTSLPLPSSVQVRRMRALRESTSTSPHLSASVSPMRAPVYACQRTISPSTGRPARSAMPASNSTSSTVRNTMSSSDCVMRGTVTFSMGFSPIQPCSKANSMTPPMTTLTMLRMLRGLNGFDSRSSCSSAGYPPSVSCVTHCCSSSRWISLSVRSPHLGLI